MSSQNENIEELVRRIVRHLEKPPVPVQTSFANGRTLRNPGAATNSLSNLSRGVVGTNGTTAGE